MPSLDTSMQPYFLLALAALGTLILLMVGWAVSLLQGISRTLLDHSRLLVRQDAVLFGVEGSPGLVSRMNELHAWRNKIHEAELTAAADEIRDLKMRRATDHLPHAS